MTATSVSVIIPTYNAQNQIVECLQSILAQSLMPREVIVVDDASHDETPRMVTELCRAFPVPLRLIRLARNSGGPARPFNTGIAATSSLLIATLEQDDRMQPTRLEKQARCFSLAPDVGVVCCKSRYVPTAGRLGEAEGVFGELRPDVPMQLLAERCYRVLARDAYNKLAQSAFAPCSALMFPRSIWYACGGFDEDVVTACDCSFLEKGTRVHDLGFVDECLIDWRISNQSLYHSAGALVRARDMVRVLGRFDSTRLSIESRALLRSRRCAEALAAAYCAREQKLVHAAAYYYLMSVCGGRPTREAIRGLATLLPHAFLRRSS